jgi:CheY-like chemotaxis protein
LSPILIVDDESNIRFLVRITLENAGYEVIEAHHGAAALERTRESPPALIVTDLMMPVMGGRELIRRLRADPATASIPILVLSGNAALDAGEADAALPKPFDPQALVESIRTITQEGGRP